MIFKSSFSIIVFMKLISGSFLGNTYFNYILSLSVLLLLYFFSKCIVSKLVRNLEEIAKKTQTKIDDVVISVLANIKPFEYFLISFYISVKTLKFIDYRILTLSKIMFLGVVLYRVIMLIDKLIGLGFEGIINQSKESEKSIRIIRNIVKIMLWIFGLLFLLHNIGLNVNSILAGIGIGGVAIALASQTILKDIFSFFVILIDKPFQIGDFIILPSLNIIGNIEEIGLKTTKIRSLNGEMIVITNSKITEEVIQNFTRMKERRVVGKLGVVYQTPVEKIKKIDKIIEDSIRKQELVRFDRVSLLKFSDFSLDFEFVYYVLTPDYNQYIKINEEILIEIAKKFKEEGIDFAYPTQTIYLNKGGVYDN